MCYFEYAVRDNRDDESRFLICIAYLCRMKIFALFLSFYILLLAGSPCGDGQECDGEEGIAISMTSKHQEHTHQSEACTPFCTCSCCAASTVFQFSIASVKIPKTIFAAVKYPQYLVSSRPEISFSIWQPPKIA